MFVIALIALTGCISTQPRPENTINVQGDSELTFDPDEAEVWAGISILKDSATEAQSEANIVINDIIDGLRYKGIREEDIETDRLSLREEYSWKNGEREIVGWRATQTLKIKTTDLNKVGTIVDVAVNNGANQINNIFIKELWK